MESAINDKIQSIYTTIKPFFIRRGIAIVAELDQLHDSKLFKRMDMTLKIVFIVALYKYRG